MKHSGAILAQGSCPQSKYVSLFGLINYNYCNKVFRSNSFWPKSHLGSGSSWKPILNKFPPFRSWSRTFSRFRFPRLKTFFSFLYFLSDIQSYFQMQITLSLGICSDQTNSNDQNDSPYKEISRSEKAESEKKDRYQIPTRDPKKKKNFFHLSDIFLSLHRRQRRRRRRRRRKSPTPTPATVTDFFSVSRRNLGSCEAFKNRNWFEWTFAVDNFRTWQFEHFVCLLAEVLTSEADSSKK